MKETCFRAFSTPCGKLSPGKLSPVRLFPYPIPSLNPNPDPWGFVGRRDNVPGDNFTATIYTVLFKQKLM